MLPPIVEDVDERVPDLARRSQLAGVVPICPYGAVATEEAVHRLRDADREPAYTALELRRPVRFHQQVQMVTLNTELKNSEGASARGCQRGTDCREDALGPERDEADRRTERHMRWTVAIVRRATAMRHPSPARRRLVTGAFAPPAPGGQVQLELSW